MSKTVRVSKVSHKPAAAPANLLVPDVRQSPMRARPRDPMPVYMSEFKIGPFIVRVSNKQHYRLYSIYTPSMVLIGRQASYPSIHDCLDKTDTAAGKGTITFAVKEVLYHNRETTKALAERSAA